jgi:hypothetical protein
MTIKSQPLDFAVSIIPVAGCAFGTCKSSADIPICSAMARASSSTLPARSLEAASKRATSVGEGIHPEASPPIGSGSVTVMTVTLAFKAFAKAIPCLTPFLARSDPSVLKRILAYIRGSLARRTFSLKSDPYLYAPIVAVRLRANLEALSWINERPVMALLSRPSMSALRPLSGLIRTLSRHRRMTESDPQRKSRLLIRCHANLHYRWTRGRSESPN